MFLPISPRPPRGIIRSFCAISFLLFLVASIDYIDFFERIFFQTSKREAAGAAYELPGFGLTLPTTITGDIVIRRGNCRLKITC
jgi:hypothetical protein